MVGTVHKIDSKWYVSPESDSGLDIITYPVHGDDILALDIIYPDSIGMEVDYELFTTNDAVSGEYVQVAKIYDLKYNNNPKEITEEDIDKAAWKFNPRPSLDVEFVREGFREGARWAIEQMNKR